ERLEDASIIIRDRDGVAVSLDTGSPTSRDCQTDTSVLGGGSHHQTIEADRGCIRERTRDRNRQLEITGDIGWDVYEEILNPVRSLSCQCHIVHRNLFGGVRSVPRPFQLDRESTGASDTSVTLNPQSNTVG